ncbi:NAD(+) diphosphatase [Kocuria tytonis]|uniref:NAD(+) diphosphatase n=1 Tax=Kocuria tytonis TaxID=2054280 RepID=A0A495A9J5_9MICC|nr:NAD(+) diphosphatase [Kocuria tytonis]RKQ36741.1 NAD(+) diphosphatase [Kocuria tytonis]
MSSSQDLPATPAPLLGAAQLPFAGRAFDRDAVQREHEDLVAEALASSTARVLVLRGSKIPVTNTGLVLPVHTEVPPATGDPGRPDVHLGRLADGTRVVLRTFPEDTQLPGLDDAAWEGLRTLATAVSPEQTSLLVTGQAIALWHRDHPRCPRCGEPTEVIRSGWARRCPHDGSVHFPRTDPAIIVAVVDDHPDPQEQRILLGRSALWSGNRYSTFAGFVEPGESAEQAVVREVGEEAGITVDTVQYQGSQPWPFPRSLMLGYRAVAHTAEVEADGEEILDVRWFTRAELLARARARDVSLPGPVSIAHALIVSWLGRELPETDW